MTLKLPDRFDLVLSAQYKGLIYSTSSMLEEMYGENQMYFFQDYTEHGLRHIQNVINSADHLITDNSFKLLNERDITVLVMAILLHDLGMHVKPEGVRKLLTGGFDSARVEDFDKRTWNEEWSEYFREVRRFNEDQVLDLFGKAGTVPENPTLDNLTDDTRKLYGEFIRRLHPRLAHEISMIGFPTTVGDSNIVLNSKEELVPIMDLAGLVARSHGLNLRMTFDYLEKRYQDAWRSPLNVKVVFLMVVLRIADYLQIQSDRAPKIILVSKRIGSPLSQAEWEKQGAVIDVSANTTDPERLFVVANPKTSRVYLDLKELLRSIQFEIDTSWASLGEVYGNDERYRQLGIKYRRVRSTIDNNDKFSTNVNYLPERVAFDADPELLKLLIGPLYGEDPKYGVRELLQNSVDAVRERKFLKGISNPIWIKLEERPYEYFLTIEDEGMGMSAHTLVHYFFRAGASFRNSMYWKKQFVEEHGAEIQKSGRFGVGVLAIFLLGDEFELATKYDESNSQGYYCRATLGSKQIEVLRKDCKIGTSIRIRLKLDVVAQIEKRLEKEAYDQSTGKLDWFRWYHMNEPEIKYQLSDRASQVFSIIGPALSANHASLNLGWRTFKPQGYQAVHWTIPLRNKQSEGMIICNGFEVKRRFKFKDESYKWRLPIVSIFDNNARLPLSLNRDYVDNDELPFEIQFLNAISYEVMKSLLEVEFTRKGNFNIPQRKVIRFDGYEGIDLSDFVVVSGDSYTLLDPLIFVSLDVKSFTQIWVKESHASTDQLFTTPNAYYQASGVPYDTNLFYKNKLDSTYHDEDRLKAWFSLGNVLDFRRRDSFTRAYIKRATLDHLSEPKKNRLRSVFVREIQRRAVNSIWTSVELRGLSTKTRAGTGETTLVESNPHKTAINPNAIGDSYRLIIERFFENTRAGNSFFVSSWINLLGTNFLIPVDRALRPQIRDVNE